jgi:P63C domain
MSKAENQPEHLGNNDRAKGGRARAAVLSPQQRREIASKAALARWNKSEESDTEVVPAEAAQLLPVAKYKGYLNLLGIELPCYVLSTGQRVIGRTSMNEMLTGIKGGGDLEAYLSVQVYKDFIKVEEVKQRMLAFRLPDVEGLDRNVKGLPNDLVVDICTGMVSALDAYSHSGVPKMSARQIAIATKAGMFLAACAKVGLDALVDEATGYQYERAEDALQWKLRLYLADAMRQWERTFPDELWKEFARLTGWKGSINSRPKYWGKLVMELVYEYLDPDVAQWLRENAPKPRHGQNYHQWLSDQYGLKKLIEHIWMLIGIAKTCSTMTELRDRIGELNGKFPIQLRMYLPMPEN